MEKSQHAKRRCFQAAAIVILAAFAAVFFLRSMMFQLVRWEYFPKCAFYTLTGYLCPACGNTRAILHLLQGHILRSIGYNPMIFTIAVTFVGWYIELVCRAFWKPVKILPRKLAIWLVIIFSVVGYDIIRNFFPLITLCL